MKVMALDNRFIDIDKSGLSPLLDILKTYTDEGRPIDKLIKKSFKKQTRDYPGLTYNNRLN